LNNGTDGNYKELTKDNFGSYTSVIVTSTANSLTDSATIILVDEGSGNVQSVLSNPVHTFQADFTGSVSDFSGGGTTLKVYEGATELTFESASANMTSSGLFSASLTTYNITAGTFSGDDTTIATLGIPSSMTSNIAEIRIFITGSTQNNTAFSLPVTQSFAKSVAGAPPITTILSNEAHTFAGNTSGLPTGYGASGTTISVFEGINLLTYTGEPSSSGY